MPTLSRRHLLQGATALVAGSTLSQASQAQTTPQKNAVLLIHLYGGYNALFSSAKSFLTDRTFGTSAATVHQLTSDLFVDKQTFGQNLSAASLARMATVGVNHHQSGHLPAQKALWSGPSDRSSALMLAKAMSGTSARGTLPCVTLGLSPPGAHEPEGGVTLQRVTDMTPTLELFGDSGALSRGTTLAAMASARTMSSGRLAAHSNSLRSLREAYDGATNVLTAPATTVNYAEIAAAYGVTGTVMRSFKHQMAGAEAMIRLGTKVVLASSTGWDSHGDISGNGMRLRMNEVILPGLRTLLDRLLVAGSGVNLTVAILGDFARSLPGSDHASCLAATVIGSRVRTGTTGVVDARVGMPGSTPGAAGLWSYLAATANVAPSTARALFGENPHGQLLLP